MLLEKVEGAKWSAQFAKKKEDVNNGDVVTIVGDAERQPDSYNPGKTQTAVRIRVTDGSEYMVALSQTSINILINTFGTNDAAAWIGKQARILLNPTVIGGKKVIVLYLVGTDWTLDEYGSPCKNETGVQPEAIKATTLAEDLGVNDAEEIHIEDVPF